MDEGRSIQPASDSLSVTYAGVRREASGSCVAAANAVILQQKRSGLPAVQEWRCLINDGVSGGGGGGGVCQLLQLSVTRHLEKKEQRRKKRWRKKPLSLVTVVPGGSLPDGAQLSSSGSPAGGSVMEVRGSSCSS